MVMGTQQPMDSLIENNIGNKEKTPHPSRGKGPSTPNQNK